MLVTVDMNKNVPTIDKKSIYILIFILSLNIFNVKLRNYL